VFAARLLACNLLSWHVTVTEAITSSLRQTIEDVLCIPDEEKETMRAALLAQISEVALPEGDSDDEEGAGEGRESSDDGSDSDTVENVVLPSRCHSLFSTPIGSAATSLMHGDLNAIE
jgi:hypothetical protein